MAVALKMDVGAFKALLSEKHATTLTTLLSFDGVKLDLGFYSIIIVIKDKSFTAKMAASTSSLLKGTVTGAVLKKSVHDIEELIDVAAQYYEEHVATEPTKVTWDKGTGDGTATGSFEHQPKEAADEGSKPAAPPKDSALQGFSAFSAADLPPSDPSPLPKAKKIPVSQLGKGAPIKLALATHIGQDVKGTGEGSTYKVVALSERVKLAVRLHGTDISFRIEGKPNTFEKGRIGSEGFTPSSSGHWSLHLTLAGLPPSRVVGAVLLGLALPFDQQIKNLAEAGLKA